MSKLDIRGHEVLDPVPFQPTIPVKKPLWITAACDVKPFDMMDYVRQQLLRAKMEADDQIQNESDLAEDMLDFETEHTYGDELIGPSPYEIGDDVPDGYVQTPAETPKQPETVPDLSRAETAPETPTEAQE